MTLQDKTIILTGGKRIGKTVGHFLAGCGANLAVTYRESEDDANEIVADAISLGAKAKAFKADLSLESDINQLIDNVEKEFGQIDGLVHMASPYPPTPLGKITESEIDKINRAIVGSAILLVQASAEQLKNNNGKVILFSDWSSLLKPFEEYIVYNAAKAGIDSVTKSLARRLAPEVTVNAIAPGPILKPPDLSDEDDKRTLDGTPLGRWGGPEEIAKAVIYLLESDFVTGVILPVDGGRSIA